MIQWIQHKLIWIFGIVIGGLTIALTISEARRVNTTQKLNNEIVDGHIKQKTLDNFKDSVKQNEIILAKKENRAKESLKIIAEIETLEKENKFDNIKLSSELSDLLRRQNENYKNN